MPSRGLLEKKLPEWLWLEKIARETEGQCRILNLGCSSDGQITFPLVGLTFGSQNPKAPVLGVFGGVHGLERIGSQVALSLLQSFSQSLLWDQMLEKSLEQIRVIFMPMINPLGMLNKTRANPAGVDLMRNAPIEAEEKSIWPLVGQRLSSSLPWYRGQPSHLEPESQALIDFCHQQFFESPAVITVDLHSGFGLQDQIWFPYAKSTRPFPHLAQMTALIQSFERTHPHHFYRIEPQALNYTTHGDLWDFLHERYSKKNPGIYLPFSIEMGSWNWIRKNPRQLFSILGPFNPVKPHRQKRILRRHMTLFDFFQRSTLSNRTWTSLNPEQENKYLEQALVRWYKTSASQKKIMDFIKRNR